MRVKTFGKAASSQLAIVCASVLLLSLPRAAAAQTSNPSVDFGAGAVSAALNASSRSVPAPARASMTPPPATASWTGLYVGGIVGNGMGKADAVTSTVYTGPGYFAQSSVNSINANGAQSIEPSHALFGGEAGFNGQVGSAVIGVEGDFSQLKFDETQSDTVVYPDFSPTSYTISQSIKTTWMVTIRGRVGVAAGPALIYGTGGLAFTDFEYDALFTDNFATAHESAIIQEKPKKFVYGGGVEVKVGPHASVKGEFLRVDFGDFTTTSTNLTTIEGPSPTNIYTHTTNFVVNALRFGVNVGF
jgi:outer membrane immunogenic protein